MPPARYRTPRLPIEPLERECHRQGLSPHNVAKGLGIHFREYKAEGLTWQAADRLACAVGMHPVNLWGDEWMDLCAFLDEFQATKAERAKQQAAARYRARVATETPEEREHRLAALKQATTRFRAKKKERGESNADTD